MDPIARVSTATPEKSQNVRSRFDRRSLGGLVLAGAMCAVLLLSVWLVSRNAPSATSGITDRLQLAAVSADDGCEIFGRYWTETSNANVDPVSLERFTNCRVLEDGTWVAGSSMYGVDALDETTLTAEQLGQMNEARDAIAAQVDDLEAVLPNSVASAFERLYLPETQSVVGHFREGESWGSYRTRYSRIVNAFMLDPDHAELASFIGWTMARKIDGYADFRRTCLGNSDVTMLHNACRGMEDNLSIRYAPLPWDLRDTNLIDTWYYETVVEPTLEAEE
jgi:hypothetical protein